MAKGATIYEYDDEELVRDKDSSYSIEEVQAHYAFHFKELAQATYTVSPAKGDQPRKVIFAKTVGVKGNETPALVVVACLTSLKPKRIAALELLTALQRDDSTENLLALAPEIEAALKEIKRISETNVKILEQCIKLTAIPVTTTPLGF